MLEKTSLEIRENIISEFTKQLVRNSFPFEFYKLKNILRGKGARLNSNSNFSMLSDERKSEISSPIEKKIKQTILSKRKSFIMPFYEPIEGLRPMATEMKTDVGRLAPLLGDPAVKIIVCQGPQTKIIVRGEMGEKLTNLVLNKQEIEDILKNFSEVSRIPLDEGVFRAAVGRLIIMAEISRDREIKFELSKIQF